MGAVCFYSSVACALLHFIRVVVGHLSYFDMNTNFS
jgi:hypothetical protein